MNLTLKLIAAGVFAMVSAGPAQIETFAQDRESAAAVVEYLRQGSALYVKHDYKNAIEPYSKALELEKKKRTLDQNLWRVLVDNLGISYGITGDLKKARETFEYGVSNDSEYPMFYYNLACTFAEMNDLEKAIAQLKKAFEFRQNMIPGETLPDPAHDDSFERFLQNPRFVTALEEMRKKK